MSTGGGGVRGGRGGRGGVWGDSVGSSERFGSGGLNPNRQRGFSDQHVTARVETPSLNEMRAKQGALVSRFMTFFQRKCSLVIEMYEASFYRRKPDWDKIAEFIYKDLCGTPDMRLKVLDVQFHPVKMLLFIKCSDEQGRNSLVEKVQSVEGVTWSEYGVRVKGYSLDAQVKFIRLLGASPETTEVQIKETFQSLEIGEVIEIKRGFLDAKRLPGVTNGTWALRVKILDPEKVIPSYIHRRDEGELWSLNFEGRVFCCWKCGSGNHIGDKCREQSRTFEEVFNGSLSDEAFVKPSWAAVVRSGHGESAEQVKRMEDMEARLKEENKRKDRERKEYEEGERLKQFEREKVIEDAAKKAKQLKDSKEDGSGDDISLNDDSFEANLDTLSELGSKIKSSLVQPEAEKVVTNSSDNPRLQMVAASSSDYSEAEAAAARALSNVSELEAWKKAESLKKLGKGINLEMPQGFGALLGAVQPQKAIEYVADKEGCVISEKKVDSQIESSDSDSETSDNQLAESRATSTPTGGHRGKKRLKNAGSDFSDTLSPVMDDQGSSENDHLESQDKKLRLEKDVVGVQSLGAVGPEVQTRGLDGGERLLVGEDLFQMLEGLGEQIVMNEQGNQECEQQQLGLGGVLEGKLGDTGQQDGNLGDIDPGDQGMFQEDGDGADQLKDGLSSLDLSSVDSVGEGQLDTPKNSGDLSGGV